LIQVNWRATILFVNNNIRYSKEVKMNDKTLRQNIIDELEFEPSVDASGIGVAVENSVVTLTGHVEHYWQKTAAEKAVWRVKGVKAIAEEISVRFASDKKNADDQIAARALNILEWDTAVPKNAVRVKVQSGWVTLEGEVNWQYQRFAAEDDVRKLTGVIAVSNNITIKPTVQPIDVRRRIEDALKRYAEVEAREISIKVHEGGTVTLEGRVDNWEERKAVERAAWSAPGVRTVEDRITIG
jgi:osmotically-inducible protein OsmY